MTSFKRFKIGDFVHYYKTDIYNYVFRIESEYNNGYEIRHVASITNNNDIVLSVSSTEYSLTNENYILLNKKLKHKLLKLLTFT